MDRLIVKNIMIIDYKNKKAKYQSFDKNINVITSDGISTKGNGVGKSSLLRRIFHTLGADSKYSGQWEIDNKYVYILDFLFNDKLFTMVRNDNLFKLFDENKNKLFECTNRTELSKELKKRFNFSIYLKSFNDKYEIAHPVYNYLLNYIEQKNICVCKFESFNNLTAFKNYYNDVIYSLVGLKNAEYNSTIELLSKLKLELKKLKEENDSYLLFLHQIQSNNEDIDPNDVELLKNELSLHREKYEKELKNSSALRKKIFELSDYKVKIQQLLSELMKKIKDNQVKTKEISAHKCPLCNSEINNISLAFFKVENDNQNINYQILDLEKKLVEIENEIGEKSERYKTIVSNIVSIENEIKNIENSNYLYIFGFRKIKSDLLQKIGEINKNIDSLELKIKLNEKELRKLNKIKKNIDSTYYMLMLNDKQKYNLCDIDEKQILNPTKKFSVDGTFVNLALVVWLTNLLKVREQFYNDRIDFPIIYDNPDNACLTEENEKMIFNYIFENLGDKYQIITSTVGFDKNQYQNRNINVIKLEGQRELLKNDDFLKCNDYLSILNIQKED